MSKLRASVPIAALLLVMVASSGCTVPVLNIEIPGLPDFPGFGPTTVQDTHDIIVIKSMEIVPDTIDSGQTAQVLAYIQNVGDTTVGGDVVDGTKRGVDVDLYDYCEGLYTPTLLTCGIQQFNKQGETKCTIDKILPGEIVPVIWSVCQNRAEPTKVRTVCPTEGMKMSVRYHYDTTSITTISLIGLSEMQREMIERRYDTDNGYISLGQGPIKPILTVEDKQPIPVYDIMPGSSQTNADVVNARTVLKLQLQNKGSGQLDSKMNVKIGDTSNTREVIAIPGSNIKMVSGIVKEKATDDTKNLPILSEADCFFMSGGWASEPVRMIGTESSPYYCIIDLSGFKGKVTMTTSRRIEVNVAYDYLVTKSAMITIDPKIAG
jgi:hypothetical protein